MKVGLTNPDNTDLISSEAVAFLAELARNRSVQEGDFETVVNLICERCLDLVDARFVTVWVRDQKNNVLRSIARFDRLTHARCHDVEIPLDKVHDELATLEQHTFIISDDALSDERLAGIHDEYLRQNGIAALLKHVVRTSGTDIGLLSFERTEKTVPWQARDAALARGVCSYLALTAVNQQKAEIERQSADNSALQRAILDNASYAVIATDVSGTITFFNRAPEEMLGYSSAEIVGKHTPVVFHDANEIAARAMQISIHLDSEIPPDFQVFVARSLAGERNADEWTYIHRDGSRKTVLLSVSTLRNRGGELTGFLGIASDVTERNAVSSRLRQSEEMLSRVLLQSPDAILITALSDGRILDANPGFVQITGYARTEAIGRTTVDFGIWADLAERNEMLRQARTIGEVKSMPIRILRRGTELRHCVLWGRTFEHNGIPALLTSVHDVSDIKAAEAAAHQSQLMLRASEDKLRSLFALSPLGINLQDIEGRYIEANDAFLSLIGYERNELVGHTCYDLIPEEYLAEEPARLKRLHETGIVPAYEKAYRRKDGSLVPVSTTTVLVTGADGAQFKWTIVEDITVRRQAEEAQRRLNSELERMVAERTAELQSAMEGLMRSEKLASLGSLVAGVAHEISTPVGNASLAASTLAGAVRTFEPMLEGKLTRTGLENFVSQVKLGVDITNRNIERVSNLIQSFKQVAVDQTSSQRRTFQLQEVVDEIITTMHPSIRRAGVTTLVDVAPDITLDSYPGPLGQVLTNLINNALIHAFPKDSVVTVGEPRIEVKAARLGSDLQLTVADNGAGIPASALGRIFDPFFTSRLGHGGSGLGLHIVHNIIVEMLAGSIDVSSQPSQGTIFTITIPVVTPNAPDVEQGR
ncbi:PAS domain S-box protein [Dongia sp.]|uniref:PAS domain-containing protein n=1 Tax=Dongia sp. TaxID=1977262 RepID=UPI0035B3B774